jgi:hypothetical protein
MTDMPSGFNRSNFVALTKVIYRVISSVYGATGYSQEYQALSRVFNTLLPILDTVERLNAETGNQILRPELNNAVQKAVDCINVYERSLQKHAVSFEEARNSVGVPRKSYQHDGPDLEIETDIMLFVSNLSAYNDAISKELNTAGV